MEDTKSFLLRNNPALRNGDPVWVWSPTGIERLITRKHSGKFLQLLGLATPRKVTSVCISYCKATKRFITNVQVGSI